MNGTKSTTPQKPGLQPAKLIKLTNIASVESLGKALTDEWIKIKAEAAHATDELKIKAFNEAVFSQANKIYAVLDLDLEINTNIVNTEIETTRDKLEANPEFNLLSEQPFDEKEKALLESIKTVELEAENFKKAIADLITNSEEIAKGLLHVDQNPTPDTVDFKKILISIALIAAAAALFIISIIGLNMIVPILTQHFVKVALDKPSNIPLLGLRSTSALVVATAGLIEIVLSACLAGMSIDVFNNRVIKAPENEQLDFLNGKLEDLNAAHDTLQEIAAKPILGKDAVAK